MDGEPHNHHVDARARAGLLYGCAAYVAWGLVPLYFKLVAHVPPIEVLAHRVLWSAAFLAVLLTAVGGVGELRAVWRDRRALASLAASSVLIAINWLTFIYAVSSGQVLQASLGYFVTPLVAVLLGVIFLRERLRVLQVVAAALAAVGVVVLTAYVGRLPWIGIALALSFGFYGLLRKTTRVGSLVGLAVETSLLLPLALPFVVVWSMRDWAAPTGAELRTYPLLMAAGVVTAVPLIWFATAARRLRLVTLGFLQYIGPTGQFLVALWFGERFTAAHGVAFAFIWAALVLFSVDSVRALRARRATEPPPAAPAVPMEPQAA